MQLQLSSQTKFIRVSNAVAAGTTDVTPSAGVDMTGFDSVCFFVLFGTITASAVTSIKAQQSSDDGSSDAYSDLEASSVTVADTDDNKIAWIDIHKPGKLYVLPIVDRGTQNAVVDGIFAVLYNARDMATTHDSSTIIGGVFLDTPDEGTA